jgi:Protein of unknown function (DUF1579)
MATTTKKKPAKSRAKTAKKAAKPARKKPAAKPMSQERMMALWEAAMTPSEGHARLGPMVGTWSAKTTFLMAPGEAAHVSEGTSEHRLILGGRYLEQAYSGTSMGMPFEGRGITGYDNVRKRYFGIWLDSFGTGIITSIGTGRPTADKMTAAAEGYEPSGKKVVFDTVVRIQDHDHHTYEMWTKAPNGKRFRNMLVEYERA